MGLGVYNQINWPGVGDTDDCWVIATFWALVAGGIVDEAHIPSVKAFRAAAGVPDVYGRKDGGSNQQILKALNKILPQAGAKYYSGTGTGMQTKLKGGYIVSLAVNSALLPSYLQFGFKGSHQIAVIYQGGKYYVMNPLARQGSALLEITASALYKAAYGFLGDGKAHGVMIKIGGAAVKKIVAKAKAQKGKVVRDPTRPPPYKQAPARYLDPWEPKGFLTARHPADRALGNLPE
jgi:hypothetical protein